MSQTFIIDSCKADKFSKPKWSIFLKHPVCHLFITISVSRFLLQPGNWVARDIGEKVGRLKRKQQKQYSNHP